MTTQILEKTEATDKVDEKKGLTDNEIRGLAKEEIPFSSLNVEKQQEFRERFVIGEEEIPDESKSEDKSEPDKEQKTESKADEGKVEVKTDPEPESALKRKLYDKSNELNTVSQKLQSAKKRMDQLEALKIEPRKKVKKEEDEDLYSEEHQKKEQDRLDKIESKLNTFAENESKALKDQSQNLQNEQLMLKIGNFQLEEIELQTSKPFTVLNAVYTKFQNDIGGPEARQKFLEDPEFRKQKEALGIVFPISDEDFKKYSTIVQVHKFAQERSYPDYESAYYIWRKENGQLRDVVSNAALAGSQAATQKIMENKSETKTLSPDDGTMGDGNSGMSEEQAMAWLKTHPQPKTQEEIKMQMLIYNKFASPGESG